MDDLTIAIATSGLTRDLKEGRVDTGGLRLDQVEIAPITQAMRRMVRELEFDVCEMAITTYLCARAYGKPFTAIPVFVTRNFHHGAIFRTADSGIREPKDLEGRTVAVNRGYTVTTGLWARGILGAEYGVDLNSITWAATDDEHVAEFEAPANVDYSNQGKSIVELLSGGTVEAGVGALPAGASSLTSHSTIRCLARCSRLVAASSLMSSARATSRVPNPQTVLSTSASCCSRFISGWQHANIMRSRLS